MKAENRNHKTPKTGGLLMVLLTLVGLAFSSVPALAADGTANAPLSCQAFADTYARAHLKNPTLPSLFARPFDFETLDWMDLDVGKAVDVLKDADITEFPGVSGAFFCMADGTIKQINACIDTSVLASDTKTFDDFARMSAVFLAATGAGDKDVAKLTATMETVKKNVAETGAPGDVNAFFMAGYARSAFLNANKKGVCFAITQALNPQMQERLSDFQAAQ